MTLLNNNLSIPLYDEIPTSKNENKSAVELKEFNGTLLHDERPHYDRNEVQKKFIIVKNLLILSFAFMFLFTAFQSLQNLQSSLNTEDGIGTLSLSIFYASFIVSSLFLPPFVIDQFGLKTTLCSSAFSYCLLTSANFKSDWLYFALPICAIITGLSSAPLWAAQGTYINMLGKHFASITKEEHRNVTARFFGIFALFFASAQIWGNLIASYILGLGKIEVDSNSTTNDLKICGKNFCPSPFDLNHINHTNFDRPNSQVYILCGTYLSLGFFAVILVLLFLDNIDSDQVKSKQKPSLNTLMKTIKNILDPRQALLIPLTTYVGIQLGFMASEFTAAFVSCTWGIEKIGFVMMSYGITNCCFSVIFGLLVNFITRIPIFFFAIIINISLLSVMLIWSPTMEENYIFFVIASLWGIGDAVWQSQCMALYGALFTDNQEAGFSNKCLWESVGFTIAFAYSPYLCTIIKIYILLTMISIAAILYCFVEYLDRKKIERK